MAEMMRAHRFTESGGRFWSGRRVLMRASHWERAYRGLLRGESRGRALWREPRFRFRRAMRGGGASLEPLASGVLDEAGGLLEHGALRLLLPPGALSRPVV